jgi:hypothetical protein
MRRDNARDLFLTNHGNIITVPGSLRVNEHSLKDRQWYLNVMGQPTLTREEALRNWPKSEVDDYFGKEKTK